jgi:hypothetical protein
LTILAHSAGCIAAELQASCRQFWPQSAFPCGEDPRRVRKVCGSSGGMAIGLFNA